MAIMPKERTNESRREHVIGVSKSKGAKISGKRQEFNTPFVLLNG